jgi:hypothetical protein
MQGFPQAASDKLRQFPKARDVEHFSQEWVEIEE